MICFSAARPIRVLVVDDSALVRSLLKGIIDGQKDMACVGVAHDPLIAREMIRALSPDVLTLDVEMPRMDGLDFLGRLMRLRPMPVIMISTRTARGTDVTLRALELGAVDFVEKPRIGGADGLAELRVQIVEKIRTAAGASVKRGGGVVQSACPPDSLLMASRQASAANRPEVEPALIAIGASTGGPEAIREVLTRLPSNSPAILITQHMPAGFTHSFAIRLNALCQVSVREAVHGEQILSGNAYIAPGGMQFQIDRCGPHYVAIVEDGDFINRHKPSVDVLFQSVARVVGRSAIGVLLSGMGSDGARAMRELKDAGAYNFVQDERSCVVFGMPRAAILHGGVDEVLPLPDIASAIVKRLNSARHCVDFLPQTVDADRKLSLF